MSILKNVSHRLKTDIGQSLRAQVDVDFSRQLTQDKFNKAAQDKEDRRADNIRIQNRRDKVVQEANKQKAAIQTKVAFNALDNAAKTGDYDPIVKMLETPGMIDNVKFALNAGLRGQGRDLAGIKFEQQQKMDFAKLSADEKRASLDKEKYETQKDQFNATHQLKREKLRFEKMQDLRETNNIRNNRNDMISFIEQTPDIQTESERSAFITRLKSADASPASVNKVWDEIMARLGDRLSEREKNHRAKLSIDAAAARKRNSPITTSPTKIEQQLALDALIEQVPEFEDMDEENQNKMKVFTAFEIHKAAKDNRISQNDGVAQAIQKAKAGVQNDGTTFLGFDTSDETFSIGQAVYIMPSEEDIAATMSTHGMTREQVITEDRRRKGFE